MKKYIKCIIFLIILIIFPINSVAQNIIKCDEDTMITITTKQVDIINGIIIDFENSKKNIELYKEIINIDSLSLKKKDSIISIQSFMFDKKEYFYKNSIKDLEKSIKTEKRKKTITNSVLGGIVVALGILFLVK